MTFAGGKLLKYTYLWLFGNRLAGGGVISQSEATPETFYYLQVGGMLFEQLQLRRCK